MQDDRSYSKDKHLRLTLQVEGKKATVLDADVIDEPLVVPGRVVGPFVISTIFDGGLVWVDSMQDPFVCRGVPRRGEHEHHYGTKDSVTIVARVPIPTGAMPDDFRVAFYRVIQSLPERVSDLAKLLSASHPRGLEHVSSVDLPMLQKHSDWRRVMERAGLKPRGSN